MKQRQLAAVIGDPLRDDSRIRLENILAFLGIPSRTVGGTSECLQNEEERPRSIIAPLSSAAELLGKEDRSFPTHSFFFYGAGDQDASMGIGFLTGDTRNHLKVLENNNVAAVVSQDWPELTGPLHGLTSTAYTREGDRVAAIESEGSVRPIVNTPVGLAFFSCECRGARVFVSCSSEIPDLAAPVAMRGYDVRPHFLSAVPLVMYLKWVFQDACWQPNERNACWIVDDPVLRTRYGFCDFPLLAAQMKQYCFTTNVAMIPWNSRRTSPEMAALVKQSEGRLSVSVHGCDHTVREFATGDVRALNTKTQTARRRMEEHRKSTGVEHDSIMVFPQGVFSRNSLRALQNYQFVAAVNTDVLPFDEEGSALTVADVWQVAILRYGSFPLFTRRYPSDGIENFAFDLLLGKPCLLVEHHGFFKDDHAAVIRFVQALNSLNAPLHWRGLGGVIRRSFQSRLTEEGAVLIRMFANELLVRNSGTSEREYRIEKANQGSVGVEEVVANGNSIEWKDEGCSIVFSCIVPSGAEVLLHVRYSATAEPPDDNRTLSTSVKVAARRYLCEFRDEVLSRHEGLMLIAQQLKRLVSRS